MLRAQSLVEYALIVATVAVLVLLGTAAFGNSMHRWFDLIISRVTMTTF